MRGVREKYLKYATGLRVPRGRPRSWRTLQKSVHLGRFCTPSKKGRNFQQTFGKIFRAKEAELQDARTEDRTQNQQEAERRYKNQDKRRES